MVRKTCGPFWTVAWVLSFLIIRKTRSDTLLQWKGCFFLQKLCFQQPFRFFKKCSYKFYSNRKENVWTLTNCSFSFVMLDNTRKTGQIIFSSLEKMPFSSKTCVFNNLLGPSKSALKKSTVKLRTSCETLKKLPWHLSCSIIREIMGQILFIGNVDFFSNFCVFSKFSGPKKIFSTLGSNGKNSLWTWTLLFCSLSFVMLDKAGKMVK